MSVRINLHDIRTADRLIEALYNAAGQRPHTRQATEWLAIAAELEAAIDQLPPTYPPRERHLHAVSA